MLPWIIAAAAALAFAALQYAPERRTRSTSAAAALRFLAAAVAIALLLDAPRGRATTRAPLVALDASASWHRGRADSAFAMALERARAAAAGDTVWLVGDSLRPADGDAAAHDASSRVQDAVDRSLGLGRPLMLVTDGEIDDPRAMDRVLAGSRIDVAPAVSARDAALLALETPRSAVGGDSIEVLARLTAGGAGSSAGVVALSLDGAPIGRVAFDSLAPHSERDVRAVVRVPPNGAEHRIIRAEVSAPGDLVAGNDSLAATLDVAAVPRAVFVSTAPDQDARFALEVLRGTLAIAVRAYYRVAPGVWRQEPGFTAATELAVRQALADAPLAIIHGDTALFGAPRAFTTGALALIAPTEGDGDEWYVTGVPASPIANALSGIPLDSLPPLALGASPTGEWTGLTVRRPRAQIGDRALIAGSAQPRRVAVVAGSGLWRWRFRGGASADAFAAVWGGVFDWMAAGGDDRRAAVPATAWTRAGEPVLWRRGARRDSAVTVMIARTAVSGSAASRASGDARVDTVTLNFPGDAILAESPPLEAGEYDVTMPGGRTRLAIAPSREWLPRAPTVASGALGEARPTTLAPRLRDAWWPYVLLLVALCAEWLVRRRAGLR